MSPRRKAKPAPAKRWNRLTEEEIDSRVELGPSPSLNRQSYDPDERQVLPKDGAWIMVIRPLPPLVGGLDEHIRPGRFFFAERDPGGDEDGFCADGTYKAVVQSEWGEVKLFPYEYARMETDFILQCWQAEEIRFHPLHIEAARLNEVTFYAMSRGVPLASAVVMALGTLNTNIGWFEPAEAIAAEAEVMASQQVGFGLTSVNHQRRAAARRRRTALTPPATA